MASGEHPGLSIGQAGAKFGVSVHTLRFYEREGLLSGIRRNAVNRRVYDDADLEWLAMCLNLRATGMPIPTIRRYAELAALGDEIESLIILLRDHRESVQDQILRLSESLDLVDRKIEMHSGAAPVRCEVAPTPRR